MTQDIPLDDWCWYWSADGERFHGPAASREAAYACAVAEECGSHRDPLGFWAMSFEVMEAVKRPVELAALVKGADLIDYLHEGPLQDYADEDGDINLDVSTEAEHALSARLPAAISEWQAGHNIVIVPWTFSETRNRTKWTVPFPVKESTA